MSTVIEPDTRGIDALSGVSDDNVAPLPELIFEQLWQEMADQFPATDIDLDFDEQPWRGLPAIEDLEYLWLSIVPLEDQIFRLAAIANGGMFDDMPSFLMKQWRLAEMELKLKKEAADEREAESGDDAGRFGEAAVIASAAAQRGGGDLSGGSEDGDTVGAGGKDPQRPDVGTAPAVPRKRRPGKTAKGRVDDTADDPPAAA